jgi:hypothetical protein
MIMSFNVPFCKSLITPPSTKSEALRNRPEMEGARSRPPKRDRFQDEGFKLPSGMEGGVWERNSMGKCGSWHGQLWFLSKITPSFFLEMRGRVEKVSQQGAVESPFEAFFEL